jgi:hypothetical protein
MIHVLYKLLSNSEVETTLLIGNSFETTGVRISKTFESPSEMESCYEIKVLQSESELMSTGGL